MSVTCFNQKLLQGAIRKAQSAGRKALCAFPLAAGGKNESF